MRSRIIIVLLAVFSNSVNAGLVRHRGGAHVQHDKFRRFFNTSSIISTSEDTKTSTPIIISSTSSTPAIESTSSASTKEIAPATTSVQTPSTSVSAFGESSTVDASHIPSTTNSPSSTSLTGSTKPSTLSTSDLSSSALSTLTTAISASSQPQSASQSQVSSPSAVVSSSAAVVQFGPSNSAEFAPVTAKSLTATPTLAGVQYPGTQAGNKAMATGFNEVYKKLDETSQCNPNDSNQATACVLGELASCQSDGTYVLKSCPNGQSCYAMPKPSGATGVEVSCAFPSDAAARMSGDSKSSTSVVAASRATSTSQSAVTPIAGSVQSLSKFPETESVQMPVQRLSSTRQVTATPSSQAQAHTSAPEASVSAATETSGVQSTSHGTQSNSQTVAIPQSHQESPTAIADIQPSASSQAASSKQSVQTLQSFPSAEATLHTHEVPSTPSSTPSTSSPVHNQDASATHNGAAPETASAASSASMADGGRLFSLPTLAQNKLDKQVQPTASSADAQEASKAAPSPSAPTQQQPDRSMETSLAPVPHIPQAAPEAPQPTKVAAAKATPSSVDDSGIVVVPVGGPNSSVGSGANEKLAAPNTQQSATPIYITVTVTTTAYDHSPTA